MTSLIDYVFEQTLRDKVINIINSTLDIDKPKQVDDDNEVVNELCEYTRGLLHKIEEASADGESEMEIIHHLLDVAISNEAIIVLLRKYISMLHEQYGVNPEED